MKLLLTAATEAEISPLLAYLQKLWKHEIPSIYTRGTAEIHICITGAGMMSTAYQLAKACADTSYDFALQAGVAGSFTESIALGEVVFTESEQYGDLGAEDHYNFISIFDLGLLDKNTSPFANGKLISPIHPLHDKMPSTRVKGLTVNTVSGSDFTIKARKEHFACDVESMEGIAFHYVCLLENIPFGQVRSISNYVTPRDKESWKMNEAITNLNEWLISFVECLHMEAKLSRVERFINIYKHSDDKYELETGIDIPLEKLLEIVPPKEEDPLLKEAYELSEDQMVAINGFLEKPIPLNFEDEYYILLAGGIYEW